MKTNIIDDLYLKTVENLNKRKEALVVKNRQMLLEKYQPYIDKLPENMLNKKYSYHLDINYPWDRIKQENDRKTENYTRTWIYDHHEHLFSGDVHDLSLIHI